MTEKYKGMTVNERLYLGGFMNQFDEFVRTKNIDGIKNILAKVEMTGKTSAKKNGSLNDVTAVVDSRRDLEDALWNRLMR